jgi:hypothetical protein
LLLLSQPRFTRLLVKSRRSKFTEVVFEVRTNEKTFHPVPLPASIQPRYRSQVPPPRLTVACLVPAGPAPPVL